jgi:hypothetical protein
MLQCRFFHSSVPAQIVYTEALTAAREGAVQAGFNAGFAAELPNGVRMGILQGRLM